MIITKEDGETILAYHDGKGIQYYSDITNKWIDVHDVPGWCFDETKYRVKPEPKELWINEYDNDFICAYYSKDKAISSAHNLATRIAVHYREVIEE